jgi:hypothetical protein
MLTNTRDCIDADYRMRHERPANKAEAFEKVATDRAVKAFEALRSLYIAQKAAHELALVFEAVFETTAWPDMDADHVSAKARRIISMYAEALRYFEAARVSA